MTKRYLATGLILAALLAGSVLYFRSLIPVDLSANDAAKMKGNPNAPIEIIEYSNFACSHCRDIQPLLKSLLEKYPGKIKIVFRHYPAYMEQSSFWAHVAAECAASKKMFWQYHDKLFENQKEWQVSPTPLVYFIRYARELGMDPESFSDCLANDAMSQKVKKDDMSGIKLGFKTTPAFIINGEYFVGQKQFEDRAENKIIAELSKK